MTALHTLPREHPWRNMPIESLESIRLVCKLKGNKLNPKTWKIGKATFNQLGETWTTHFDFVVDEKL